MSKRNELTAERLRELLHYEPETGVFTWLAATCGHRADDVVGRIRDGYLSIHVYGREYQAHRLAWLWMTGEWPRGQIDHWDTDKANNRWGNLREATRSQNAANTQKKASNTSGFKGVTWHARNGKWVAQIKGGGKKTNLGYYTCAAKASIIHDVAAVMVFGDYANVDPSFREALNAPCEPQPRVYIRPPHERARVPCHYIQLGAPSAMFMPQTSPVERGFGVSSHQSSSASAFVRRESGDYARHWKQAASSMD